MKPKLSQQANPTFVGELNQGDLLAMQLEQANTSETTRPEAATNTQPQSGEEPEVPDRNGLTADKSNNGGTADSRRDFQIYDVMGTVDTESFHHMGASLHLKTQSLPILDNLVSLDLAQDCIDIDFSRQLKFSIPLRSQRTARYSQSPQNPIQTLDKLMQR